MAKPVSKLPEDIRKRIDLAVRHVTFGLLRALKMESPVGNPGLWAVNQGIKKRKWHKPAGYSGGTFRRSWAAVFYRVLALGIVYNPQPYAGVLARNVSPSGKAPHSRQIPANWISTRLPGLLRELAGAAQKFIDR